MKTHSFQRKSITKVHFAESIKMKLLILVAVIYFTFDFGNAAIAAPQSKISQPLRFVRAVAQPVNEPKESLEASESAYYPYPYVYPYYYPAHYPVVLVG